MTALFGLGNSSNAFLILRTQDIGASLETTILIYAAFNLVAALISYPAGSLSDTVGQKKYPARLVHHLPDRLSRLCPDAKRPSDRSAVCLLRIVSGDIPRCRQSVRSGFRAGASARQRHRLVQHHRRLAATRGQRRRRTALGSDRPCGGVLLRCGLRCRRQYRTNGLASTGTQEKWRGMSFRRRSV